MHWIWIIAGLYCLPPAFVAVFSFLLFRFECTEHETGRQLRCTWKKGMALPFLGAMFRAYVYQLGLTVMSPLSFTLRRKEKRQGNGPLIVFVHGLYHNPTSWLYYSRLFDKAGLTNQRFLSYGSVFHDLPDIAEKLKKDVKKILSETSGPVYLVGHSMGGLCIRYLLMDQEIRNRVKAAVTVGTPHRGSKMAVFGIGRSARKIRYSSAFMQKLNEHVVPQGVPMLVLHSDLDNMVLPPEGALPPEGSGWIVEKTDPVGHLHLLYHKPTVERVIKYIKESKDI